MVQLGANELVKSESAIEALKLIMQETTATFDCIFLDIRMPEMDGIELCKIIRVLPRYKNTPILMVTQMADKPNIDSAFAAGATDYFTKPVEISRLRSRLQIFENTIKEKNVKPKIGFVPKSAQTKDLGNSKVDLLEPIEIVGVKGVITYYSLENYVAQLLRTSPLGSTMMALKLKNFEELHCKASSADFRFLVTDVAEAISDALVDASFLIAYAGNGIYICVIEEGWHKDTQRLVLKSWKILEQMDLCLTGGEPLHISLLDGPTVHLNSYADEKAVDSINEVKTSIEKVNSTLKKSTLDTIFWGASENTSYWDET